MKRLVFPLLIIILLFLLLPLLRMLDTVLIRLFLLTGWYHALEHLIAPLEVRAVVVLLHLLHINAIGSAAGISLLKGDTRQYVAITWNCVGWQSILLIIITLFAGFQGELKQSWKFIAILLGIGGAVGTTLLRITIEVMLFHTVGKQAAVLFHDYGANMLFLVWFCMFWWFTYMFLAEKKSLPHLDTSDETL